MNEEFGLVGDMLIKKSVCDFWVDFLGSVTKAGG